MGKKGFTLIELVMVIVIIGILAAVAIPKFMDLQNEAKVARCQADVGAIRTGISGWYAKYHVSGNGTCPSGTAGDCVASGNGTGFPTQATMNLDTGGFANFSFSDQKMPDRAHKIANQTNGWGAYYNETTGVMDQVAACGS
jgi:prepilin-type N-terminal cleavage/methylation domain-containing protein